ncbi:DUF6349 family protein [Streptomyces murinus]|uniref:DUF6349 family protein n=1 Tax=Streptomyces murinus TaxID=33900 RepID=UPI003810CB50
MTAISPEPAGARARQTYYWQVRNARTRALATQCAEQTWRIQPRHPGGVYSDVGHELDPPEHHTPTVLYRSSPDPRGGKEFRGACLSCDWEGAVHRGFGFGDADDVAIEDAHDHAFPDWQSLPTTAEIKDQRGIYRNPYKWDQLASRYPAGWAQNGAPLLVWSRNRYHRHDPPCQARPRYELRIRKPPVPQSRQPAKQEALF